MEGVKDGGKKKRKGKWSGITRKSAKVRRMVGGWRKWRKKNGEI